VVALASIEGKDVADLRRRLLHQQATRLYLRTFGKLELRRGSWTGPEVRVDKRRVRSLLAVLAAHAHTSLTRDMAIDMLWPDADADAAVNNLNQTVFQLRRYIDSHYRGGESPEYIVSTADRVALNPELVVTDLEEIRRLPARLTTTDWRARQVVARRAVELVRGEFLADVRYESWAATQQLVVHNEIRERLMPIARAPVIAYDLEVSTNAAAAMVAIDGYDEQATIALADCLARGGRRVAARDLLIDFASRLQAELDEAPSEELARLVGSYGVPRRQGQFDSTRSA
jgi:DNA-binding SARP family transcriptional activator